MTTGQVRAEFFHTRTDLWARTCCQDLAHLLSGFFLGPKPALPSQAISGPNLQPLTVPQSVAQSIKKLYYFPKKKES